MSSSLAMKQKSTIIKAIQQHLIPIAQSASSGHSLRSSYDSLINDVSKSKVVLLGSETHGTREFYEHRAEITKRLIEEHGFTTLCLEANLPECKRLNSFINTQTKDDFEASSTEVITSTFERHFPRWIWANQSFAQFLTWLQHYNSSKQWKREKVELYGLDLFSIKSSREEVLQYLQQVDPIAAETARRRYKCLDNYGTRAYDYTSAISAEWAPPCSVHATEVFMDLNAQEAQYMLQANHNYDLARDECFYAKLNAQVVKNAEEYYRHMFRVYHVAWNIRDRHMADTLSDIMNYNEEKNPNKPIKVIVWAHNAHVQDIRDEEMRYRELTLGNIVRRVVGPQNCSLVAFTTSNGTLLASDEWDSPPKVMAMHSPIPDSTQAVLHEVTEQSASQLPAYYLLFKNNNELLKTLGTDKRLFRNVSAVYSPIPQVSNSYVDCLIGKQFDALVHLDTTSAVVPLEMKSAQPGTGHLITNSSMLYSTKYDVDNTYPFGM